MLYGNKNQVFIFINILEKKLIQMRTKYINNIDASRPYTIERKKRYTRDVNRKAISSSKINTSE